MAMNEIITYFKGFDEGDNITITGDFINNIDVLIKEYQKLQIADSLKRCHYLWIHNHISNFEFDEKTNELTIHYYIHYMTTSRTLDIENISLSDALLQSSKDLADDIYGCLEDENDFFGYENEELLTARIKKETELLEYFSEVVKQCKN